MTDVGWLLGCESERILMLVWRMLIVLIEFGLGIGMIILRSCGSTTNEWYDFAVRCRQCNVVVGSWQVWQVKGRRAGGFVER